MNKFFTKRECCPGCQSQRTIELLRSPLTAPPLRDYLVFFYNPQGGVEFKYLQDQDYVLTECMYCGLVYQTEIPGELLIYKLYEKWIDPEKVWELIELHRTLGYFSGLSNEITDVIRYFNRPPSQLTFLDFGMGWGHWCRMAQAFGCKVYGVELSEARIEYARQTGVRIINFEEISSLQFDFINTEQVFEHLSEPGGTLAYLRQSLAPDGILKISVPDGGDIQQRLNMGNWQAPKTSRYSLNPVAPLEHINCFNRASLLQLAREVSLEPIDFQVPRGKVETVRGFVGSMLRYWNRLRGNQSGVRVEPLSLFFRSNHQPSFTGTDR